MTAGSRPATAAALLLLALAGCSKQDAARNAADEVVTTTDDAGAPKAASDTQVVTVGPDGSVIDAAMTPMKDRVAVLGLLNKRNGVARELKLKPGQAARVGDVIVRLRACEKTAPWENFQDTGAFVQVDVQQTDQSWHRVFSGWLYKDRPALNVVQHPIYDVWTKSCAMTFRDSGPNTVSAGAAPKGSSGGGEGRSSARKSPSTEGAPSASPAADSPSAAPSNAI
jgi:hypothetical protein